MVKPSREKPFGSSRVHILGNKIGWLGGEKLKAVYGDEYKQQDFGLFLVEIINDGFVFQTGEGDAMFVKDLVKE